MNLSMFLEGLASEVGAERLDGSIVVAALDRPIDDLIRLAMGLGPYHPGQRSPWSHCFLLAEPYRGRETRILDCTIRAADGAVAWEESLDDLLKGGIAGSGGIYDGVVADYDHARVTDLGVKMLLDLSSDQRKRIVGEAEALRDAGYHYDIPGLVRELVRLLTGIPVPAGDKLLFCSAFCQSAYRGALGEDGDFAPAVATEDTSPDDIWYSPLGNGERALRQPAPSTRAARSLSRSSPLPSFEAVKNIVVLMLENRSFDHALGSLSLAGVPVDGLQTGMFNAGGDGAPVPVFPYLSPTTDPDPRHGLQDVSEQLVGPNKGFVTNYETLFGAEDRSQAAKIMAYYDDRGMPILHRLAAEYGVSDRWFCSLPSETWPNRLFVHGATSAGRVANGLPRTFPPKFFSFPTIYDRLGSELSDWSIYADQLPQSVCIKPLLKEWLRSVFRSDSHYRSMEQFASDCASGSLAKYSFIEPRYFGGTANDDHPAHDVFRGEELIAFVYSKMYASPLWKQSLLVIVFDEHGGFFDHVTPPRSVPAPGDGAVPSPALGFDFTSLGPRVPCVIVSPWIPKGSIVRPPTDGFFDHTSILATLRKRWGFAPLTDRDAAASDIWPCLTEATAREDDIATAEFVDAWRPPKALGKARIALAARDTLAAPVSSDMTDRTGIEIAQEIAELKRPSVQRGIRAMTAPAPTPDLNEYQDSLADLADAIVRSQP